MRKTVLLLGISALLSSAYSQAHNLQLNATLPAVTVADKGELIVKNQEISAKPWQSTQLKGKVRVLQHIAGRSSVKEKNYPLMEAIKAQHFNGAQYQTTNIINADDAIFGTGPFVRSSAEKAKKENAHSQIVLDNQSAVKNAWKLKEKESLIVVLDKEAKVKFVHEGKLSSAQINEILALVKNLL
ncbi:YtfJ family protein [Avibacterium sp. 21-599]|uniref:YtfJ family protein n=1 Tax=Avibacterium sp. 21-599 TaxID=2911528 RepID=UPI00224588BD|nr:YtfJ family protein [Avibacterium sp. 21-599]MCW9716943.1 YtfJ family protein [Avibacterium sp. 21-599]